MLNDNGDDIVDAFAALQRFADGRSHVLAQTKGDLAADFKDVYPVVKSLDDNAEDLVAASTILPTFPFPAQVSSKRSAATTSTCSSPSTSRCGDSAKRSSPRRGLDPNMKHMNEVLNPPDFLIGAIANLSGQAADPFKIPPGTATQQRVRT